MKLETAQKIAVAICYKLQPFCSRINIAGSVRRKKPEVKDIEIVCLPELVEIGMPDLFGGSKRTEIHSEFVYMTCEILGKVLKGQPTGRYMQIELPEGVNLDLFMPQVSDYFRQYAIRTGSADYSAKVIAAGWVKAGWVGTEAGLRRADECRRVADSKWECTANNPTLPPIWESEQDFFQFIGVEWIAPEKRNV